LNALVLLIYFHFWFALSAWTKRSDVADVAWGLGFGVLAIFEFCISSTGDVRSYLVLFLVLAWSLRLAGFIFRRSHKSPEDPRYAEMRLGWKNHPWLHAYFKVFWLQGVLLFAIAQPEIAVLRLPNSPLSSLDILAAVVALLGLGIEAVADAQKSKFKSDPANKGRVCDIGLWHRARHPNYFGEMVFWTGITVFTLHDFRGLWWTWEGPLLLIFLLLKVSGVPLIEKRYKGRADYEEYKKRTRLLVPL
jgi:steroid 5-alpha reductase family enzyme